MKIPPKDSLAYALLEGGKILAQVMQGRSLAEGLVDEVAPIAKPVVQDLVYNALRDHGYGQAILRSLVAKLPDNLQLQGILLLALSRLKERPDSAFVTVDQAVEAAGVIAHGKYRGLCNGVLRNALRQKENLENAISRDASVRLRHPKWWLHCLQNDHPSAWEEIAHQGNTHPPMALRVNRQKTKREDYLGLLQSQGMAAQAQGEDAILLSNPLPVSKLPAFDQGWVSVQDPGAQLAAILLDPEAGSRVLDACAAPGGKTAHLLERQPLQMTALDLSPARCRRIQENLHRLGLAATVKVGDARRPDIWWDGQSFDAILADVPCSASGVVRRHPDAKWLRREKDIDGFAATQREILDALWPCLRPGGKLLYATCSVFSKENQQQMQALLSRHSDARLLRQEQLLPSAYHDGFFYALVTKLV